MAYEVVLDSKLFEEPENSLRLGVLYDGGGICVCGWVGAFGGLMLLVQELNSMGLIPHLH